MIIILVYIAISAQAFAGNRVTGNVRIIHASSGPVSHGSGTKGSWS